MGVTLSCCLLPQMACTAAYCLCNNPTIAHNDVVTYAISSQYRSQSYKGNILAKGIVFATYAPPFKHLQ
uniref:Putative secreted protein n=1 Tax=Amblyomma triste TaxID=251400 RepID=A0A023G0V3_AMBTT